MRTLSLSDELAIVGGVLAPAIELVAVGVGVFETPILINAAITQYGQWGAQIGEGVFNATHPEVLGQMVYTIDDFSH
ncbi:MAG: hypothetical protein HYX61_04250 [Gammaproteobacteria bacterium]|jgi:hypothetical protein|nr:hypothetical protein [Gammaproteobacteria bacterium]